MGKISWVTTDLREEKPVAKRQKFPRTLHCVNELKDKSFSEKREIYIGEWTWELTVSGSALCGIEWKDQKLAYTNFTSDSYHLCPSCLNVLLDVDSMSSEQLWEYYQDLFVETWHEQGRWLHVEEGEVMEAMEEKIKKCLSEIMDN